MGKKKRTGKCHICGEIRELTFEHIPPRSAFNSGNAKIYDYMDIHESGNNCWDFTGLKYTPYQKGVGKYTLCARCNNNVGTWYVVDYANFVMNLHNAIKGHSFSQDEGLLVYAKDIYPLRIIKSVLAMFCSLNHENFADCHNIRKFLLNKTEKDLGGNCGVSMYLSNGSIMKQLPLSVIGKHDINYPYTSFRTVSEITWLPCGYIFDTDRANNKENIDITDFSKFGYNEKIDMEIKLLAREVNTTFPVDFRSKQQILEQAATEDTE